MRPLCFALAALIGSAPALADEPCAVPATVRVMLHDPEMLAARLEYLARAPERKARRTDAIRELFRAAGCSPVGGSDPAKRENVECVLPGAGPEAIVVGASRALDGEASAALLPSLLESLAVAPRRHTFRLVAFSAHTNGAPKGAARLVDARLQPIAAMIHLGPLGFGGIATHGGPADGALGCAYDQAVERSGVVRARAAPVCRSVLRVQPRFTLRNSGRAMTTSACIDGFSWRGGNDWVPFHRAGIRVLGIHSVGTDANDDFDPVLYLQSYRMLAIFLALADEMVAPPGPKPDAAPPPATEAAPPISSR